MIRLKDVEMEYPNGTRAIRGISAAIEDGEFVFLVGPSGSGKSTIIKMLTGEEVPTAGRIMINGFSVSNIAERQIPMMRRTLGVIFQDFRLIEKKTVYENLEFVMRAVGMPKKRSNSALPTFCSWWVWKRRRRISPANFPAASNSAWPLPGRW